MNVQGFTPSMFAPVQAQNANAAATTGTTGSSSSSSSSNGMGTSASSLQSTFLNLLVTELQNQDPTAPVDPTEMVGQLVSLNQLDQLISINSTLTHLVTPASATSNAAHTEGCSALTASHPGSGPGAATNSTSATAAALNQLQSANALAANPNAFMNLYGNVGAPAQTSNFP